MEETIVQGTPEITEKQEKVILGVVGALLGGILGGALCRRRRERFYGAFGNGKHGYDAGEYPHLFAFCPI